MEQFSVPDPSTPFGEQVQRRLHGEQTCWFVSVGRDGTPQPNIVWFHWDGGGTIVVYSQPAARRLVHLAEHPQVALSLDSNGEGGGIVVVTGTAGPAGDLPPADQHPGYLEKYRAGMIRVSGSVEKFAADYSRAIRVEITKIRGY